ncbi:hypothetical protein EAE99_001120 [Botrytis elliptica]|nr:hypothetical protein EAE99_001120 [Botrytis elliptica]
MSHYSKTTMDSQYNNPQQQPGSQSKVSKEQREDIRKQNEKREHKNYEQRKKKERQYAEARVNGRVDEEKDRPQGKKASERRYGKNSSGETSVRKGVHWK